MTPDESANRNVLSFIPVFAWYISTLDFLYRAAGITSVLSLPKCHQSVIYFFNML